MEKTISSEIIFRGKVITVRVDEVELPDGRQARRELVEHAGAAAVLAIDNAGDAFFVRQFRKPLEQELLEIPAGKLEPGEDPASCAVRELAEEVGMAPAQLSLLAQYYSSPGFADEKIYLYLATELSPHQIPKPEDEDLTVHKIPYQEALTMAKDGRINDGKTLIALLLAQDKKY